MADVDLAAGLDTTPTDHANVLMDGGVTPSSSPEPSTTSGDTTGDMVSKASEIFDRLAAEDAPASDPSPTRSPAQAATAPDAKAEAPTVETQTRGPIPFDRHQAVVTNTRRKALSEYGIDEQATPEDVRTATSLLKWAKTDPRGMIRAIQSQIGDEVASPAAAPSKPVEPADPEPEPDIPLADGRAVYSAEQQKAWLKWNTRQERAQAEREGQEHETLVARRKTEATHLVAEAEKWPFFNELRPKIKELLKNVPKERWTPATLHQAYIQLYASDGVRLQREAWQKEQDAARVSQLQRKSAASSVQPTAAQPVTPKPHSQKSMRERATEIYDRLAASG